MCIYNFEMQEIIEKQKKQKILRSLCHVYAHGKGPFGHFAVCIHTAKNPRGAYLCVGGCELGVQPCPLPCVLVHGARQRGRHDARQRFPHGNVSRTAEVSRTATSSGTAERMTHDRGFVHGNVPGRTAANDGTATLMDARQRATRTAKLFAEPFR
jgi:hypothetical protein